MTKKTLFTVRWNGTLEINCDDGFDHLDETAWSHWYKRSFAQIERKMNLGYVVSFLSQAEYDRWKKYDQG